MTEKQEHLLQLFRELDEICKKNNLRYVMAGGTAIGVVRNEGFIPWDEMCIRDRDKALVAGILGMQTDDERIRFSLDVAKKVGLEIQIETGELEDTHPNTAEITLTAADGEKVSLREMCIRDRS